MLTFMPRLSNSKHLPAGASCGALTARARTFKSLGVCFGNQKEAYVAEVRGKKGKR